MKKFAIRNAKSKLLIVFLILGVAILLKLLNAPCIFKVLFHHPCPGCGMTRAVFALLSLDFTAAFYFHPMVFALPLLFLFYLYDGKLLPYKRLNTVLLSLLLGGFLIVWGLRLFSVLPPI